MNAIVVAIAKIAVGVAVGNAASDAVNKFIYEPIEKIVKSKKAES